MSEMHAGRRKFIGTAATLAAAYGLQPGNAFAYEKNAPPLTLVASSPHLWNAVALMHSGRMFVGMPRWPGFTDTFSVAELLPSGELKPYPGGGWNDYPTTGPDPIKSGAVDLTKTWVCVNTIHAFDGVTLWVLDQGANAIDSGSDVPGSQKLVQIDTRTDKVIRVLTFGHDILPPGSGLNDLRIGGGKIYMTDSGLGAIVIVDLATGKAIRRLADDPSTKADPHRPKIGRYGHWLTLADGTPQVTNADPIELTADHRWLYYQAASGPLYRIETRYLLDTAMSEKTLGTKVEYVYDTPTLGGTAMDTKGNIYLAESYRPRISVLSPDGTLRTLIEDDRLVGADALLISPDRHLYIPMSQVPNLQFVQGPNGKDLRTRPFEIYKLPLPARYGNLIP